MTDGGAKPKVGRRKAETPSVKMRDFKNWIAKVADPFWKKTFEELQSLSPDYPHDVSQMPHNVKKNRYNKIYAFDRTRVKTPMNERDDTKNYINANYIDGFNHKHEYIATQGPLKNTLNDFWRMVWEHDSKVIVMLSGIQEKQKQKVFRYWPRYVGDTMEYGKIAVKMTYAGQVNKYITRIFTMKKGQEERQVHVYFMPGWEEFDANMSTETLIDVIKKIRIQINTSPQAPVIVHCSSGLGRTGTFIALDYLQQWVKTHGLDDEVSVSGFVLQMRHDRGGMVQTWLQYRLVHWTLNKMIQKKIAGEPATADHVYRDTSIEPDQEDIKRKSY
ncbi:receptor-type tyrosine-protein phosphatase O-like [Gigantopelta aegis]|uniref:receptor-type tyrosine-protein phosphatase O-like n=1 Tax=Gigantopelta aegis TaxID=1735272 RepID=UPI001B887A91|nr:receptor-type tyrosine-protein phosphatase O-like [Gigantopelta aegis]